MKTRNILTTIASIATRAIIGGAIGYAVGTAIDRIRTNIALKKSIEDAANDPRVRRVHIDRIQVKRTPINGLKREVPPVDLDDDEVLWAVVDNTSAHKVLHVGDYDSCCEYADRLNFERESYAPDSDVEFGVELAEGLDLYDAIDADDDEVPSFSEILRNTRFVVQDCVTGCAEMIGDLSDCEEWVTNHSDDPTVEYQIITEDAFLSL
jgi:hypothetical protein